MLKHEDIDERGMVEAYVRRKLAPEDSAAFEEHYFQCGKCFDDVQLVEKFVAGVEHAARIGLLGKEAERRPKRRTWWTPAFASAAAAGVVLASVLTFVVFVRQSARETRLRQEIEQVLSQARASQARIAQLEQLAALDAGPEANVPVVILTASRSADSANQVQLGSEARRALLWIDVPAQPPEARFRVTITTPDTRLSKSIHGLKRNTSGALAASLPAADLPAGSYNVRLFNEKSPGQPIAEYRLTVARR
jgi:Putative zinc-finger